MMCYKCGLKEGKDILVFTCVCMHKISRWTHMNTKVGLPIWGGEDLFT